MLHLDPLRASWPLSIDVRLTRTALAAAAAPVLLFWAAREVLARGGVRLLARVIAWAGLALTMAAVALRATPFRPFVNRNHLATWLVMGGALTAGYLVAHVRSHHVAHSSRRLVVRDWLADGNRLILVGSLAAMLLALAATLSRAAIFGATAALAFAIWFSRRRGPAGRGVRIGAALIGIALVAGVWANREEIERKFEAPTAGERMVIWRETAPLIGDFWLAGTGAGTYSRAMLRYQRTNPEVHFNQAHSEYVQILAEGGVLLAVPMAIAVWAWVRLARRRLESESYEALWLRVGAAAGLVGVAAQSLFETGLRMPANALTCALMAAIVVVRRQKSLAKPPRRSFDDTAGVGNRQERAVPN